MSLKNKTFPSSDLNTRRAIFSISVVFLFLFTSMGSGMGSSGVIISCGAGSGDILTFSILVLLGYQSDYF
ncbi:hypothetical protein Glove_519g29 [Diversispora epigaea]|uniref:Uncharacterized protein n=1 Tax=Diversispora epigaea TaxID=1348612 RepID=A0A397GF50_9GLOM|nr:hypothetical protein Glove_519g29 [Diversispora epigaea]